MDDADVDDVFDIRLSTHLLDEAHALVFLVAHEKRQTPFDSPQKDEKRVGGLSDPFRGSSGKADLSAHWFLPGTSEKCFSSKIKPYLNAKVNRVVESVQKALEHLFFLGRTFSICYTINIY